MSSSSEDKLLLMESSVKGSDYDSTTHETDYNSTSAEEEHPHKTNDVQAIIHLLKGYIGPGCLSLPWAFSQLGIFWGCMGCLIVNQWSTHNSWMTVVIKRRYPNQITTYPDVGTWAYGRGFGHYVRTCICIQQTAICTVYMSFVGANLLAVWSNGNSATTLHHVIVMTVALPAVIGVSCLASLKSMAPCSAWGGITLAVSLALVGAVAAQDWSSRPLEAPSFHWSTSPLAMSAILFSFEGISLVIPIENSMARPQSFRTTFWIVKYVVTAVFCLVAAPCVLIFGHVSNGSITAYLLSTNPQGTQYWLLSLANSFASLSVLLTYPLQMFPALELIGPLVNRRTKSHRNDNDDNNNDDNNNNDEPTQGKNDSSSSSFEGDSPRLRLGYVLVTYLIAVAVPNVQSIISLAGAIAGSSTALLIPPLVELEYLKRHHKERWYSQWRCYLIFVLAVVFMLTGAIASILNIVQAYQNNNNNNSSTTTHA